MIRWKVVFSYFSKFCAVHHTPHYNKMEWNDWKKLKINYVDFFLSLIWSHIFQIILRWCLKKQAKNIYKKYVMKIIVLTRGSKRYNIVCKHTMLLVFRNCLQSYRYQCPQCRNLSNLGFNHDLEAICRMYLSCL